MNALSFRVAALAVFLAVGNSLQAESVTNWHTLKATPATTLSGQGTANPVWGAIGTTAQSSDLIGYYTPLTLSSVGDTITLRFNVSFNDAVGMANAGDNFRFALFDLNGQTPLTLDNYATAGVDGQTDNWRGYWYGVRNGTGTGSGGSIRERTAAMAAGEDNPFSNTAGSPAVSLGTVGGTPVTLTSSVNSNGAGPLYSGEMTLTKTASGIDLSGMFTDGIGTNIFSVSDNTLPSPQNFGAVGFLNGNGLSADQVLLQNVDVTFMPVPEPSTLALAGISLAGLLMAARRKLQGSR